MFVTLLYDTKTHSLKHYLFKYRQNFKNIEFFLKECLLIKSETIHFNKIK